MRSPHSRGIVWLSALVLIVVLAPSPAPAAGNAACPGEDVFFNPGNGEDIVVPLGYKVEVFASGLNFPTGIAFRGSKENFQVFVLESGHGLPSRCNDNVPQPPLNGNAFGGEFSSTNSGGVGRDNGGGQNQQDIPRQNITLRNSVFDSGGGAKSSGYSPFGVQRPGATIKAFDSATGVCIYDGAILRATINVANPK